MKTKLIIFLLVIFAMPTINSCKKESPKPASVAGCMDPLSLNYNSAATIDNGTCQYKGQAMFWYNSNGTMATVTIGSETEYITMYYSTSYPACGASGCATFSLPPGTYTYSAHSTYSTWNGNVTVTSNGCSTVLLK